MSGLTVCKVIWSGDFRAINFICKDGCFSGNGAHIIHDVGINHVFLLSFETLLSYILTLPTCIHLSLHYDCQQIKSRTDPDRFRAPLSYTKSSNPSNLLQQQSYEMYICISGW